MRAPLNTSHFDFYKSDYLLILRSRKEIIKFRRIGEFDLDHPAFAIGIGVHELGSALEFGVDFDDFTGNRHKRIGDRLDGLDGAENLFLREGFALGLDVHENNVTELALKML